MRYSERRPFSAIILDDLLWNQSKHVLVDVSETLDYPNLQNSQTVLILNQFLSRTTAFNGKY